jgi:hypothetical protein
LESVVWEWGGGPSFGVSEFDLVFCHSGVFFSLWLLMARLLLLLAGLPLWFYSGADADFTDIAHGCGPSG